MRTQCNPRSKNFAFMTRSTKLRPKNGSVSRAPLRPKNIANIVPIANHIGAIATTGFLMSGKFHSMGKLLWYRRDPERALHGMRHLNPEQRGAYCTVLELIYIKDGKLEDDDLFIAGNLRVDVRIWRRLKRELVALDRLHIADGIIRDDTADMEVASALARVVRSSYAGQQSAIIKQRKSQTETKENNDLARTTVATEIEPIRLRLDIEDSVEVRTSTDAKASGNGFMDARTELFHVGLSSLMALTGKPEGRCRSLLGKWLKQTKDDSSLVMLAIRDATDNRVVDVVPWIVKRLSNPADKVETSAAFRGAL